MKSIEQLEFNKIKSLILAECQCELGRQKVEILKPLHNKKKIEYKLRLTSEVQEILKNKISFNFENCNDLIDLFQDFSHPTYNFEEFRRIYFNLQAANVISKTSHDFTDYAHFSELIRQIISHPELENKFQKIYESDGEIKDSASAKLSSIRASQKQLRKRIMSVLNEKLSHYESNNYLFDKIVTKRDDRFVIPIRKSSMNSVQGIAHSSSGSKSSIYIEPAEVVQLNNRIDLSKQEEKREIFKILSTFTKEIQDHQTDILKNMSILSLLDFYFASARLANSYDAEIPTISEKPIIYLINARHPLLIKATKTIKKVIPFTLELGEDKKILIISGPNTGGKTVTLKTIGLLSLMALSGLPITAGFASKIGLFTDIFADIGDNQSLENALSTFSSHIRNIDEMLKKADSRSLILIDEIGSATDPEQGSALAQAIVEKLTELSVLGVITTHYTALKIFAEEHPKCVNAAMQFDDKDHIPTYKIHFGLPGNSFAIDIASNLGVDKAVIKKAKKLTGNQSFELSEILKKMSEEKKRLSHLNYDISKKSDKLQNEIGEYDTKIRQFEAEKKEIKRKTMREARDFLATLQKKLNKELSEIKKEEQKTRKRAFKSTYEKITKLSSELQNREDTLSGISRKPINKPNIGQTVWLKDFETTANIIEVADDYVKVDMNGFHITTSLNNLFQINNNELAKTKLKITAPRSEAKLELKLLGYRFEEALPEIERFIDNAVMSNLDIIRIVHGKGTGALRGKIRQYLRSNRNAAEFYSPPPEAGGDGVTVVVLKQQKIV